MAFPPREAERLLAESRRRCCICYRFCGVKIELDHIEPRSENGPDEIENAIPVCFECHAEIHLYNDSHPRGRKYRPVELRLHKEQWLRICREQPGLLLETQRIGDVGPLQALVDELEFNGALATSCDSQNSVLCAFETGEFTRAMSEGVLSLLGEELKTAIHRAYIQMKGANAKVFRLTNFTGGTSALGMFENDARQCMRTARPQIEEALTLLRNYLTSE